MKRNGNLAVATVATLLLSAFSPWANAARTVKEFSGYGNKTEQHFTVSGPWTLEWNVKGSSGFPTFDYFEARLYDSTTGKFLGMIARNKGSGAGARYFEEGGVYYLNVLARNLHWQMKIVQAES
jgi:hypothetical protein